MDRSLWLLLRLRVVAWGRVWVRNLQTLKGVLLALVGVLVFLPMFGFALFAPRVQVAAQLDAVRSLGPLGLLVYCVLNVVLSSGDRAIYYSPAEVEFLFCGPYRPRQLLLYKVAIGVGAAALTAILMACAFTPHSARFVSSVVALFLTLELIHLFSMTIGLIVSTFGALAFTRGRRVVLVGLCLATVAPLLAMGRAALLLPPAELLDRAVRSPTIVALTLPFTPFINAFTSERIWPDLCQWSALALLVDAVFLGIVLSLNAGFLEASAAASTRIYEKIRRIRRGNAWGNTTTTRYSLPMPPWCGGIGPNLWRQLTAATRAPVRIGGLLAMFLVPVSVLLMARGTTLEDRELLGPLLSVFVGMTFLASTSIGCDFRPDVGHMEDLKTLPIRPFRLALGQLLTPVFLLGLSQGLTLGLIGVVTRADPTWLIAAGVLAWPVNLILAAVENLYFLWFPYRTLGVNSFDFQMMGRQILVVFAKLATTGVAAALAAAAGSLVYSLTAPVIAPAVVVAGAVALGCGIALVPLVGIAFEHYDVATDRAE